MAYTSENLSTIQAAIVALGAGERVVRVTLNGKTVEYGQADLAELERIESKIISSINAAASTQKPRFVLTRSTKGL